MRKLCIAAACLIIAGATLTLMAGDKGQGEKCFNEAECEFGLTCTDGACVKKKEFDYGGSGKTGKPCNNDADCIGSGTCVEGAFGKKVCSGN
ncbi:MAG: hypothetical protein A2176_12665 [Spirochaetes bacterium RBG_13_51_14]|nr:MAG: hypothetical protein A2176_12665 [Spirochaetes bacterium RBG_13_51_14]